MVGLTSSALEVEIVGFALPALELGVVGLVSPVLVAEISGLLLSGKDAAVLVAPTTGD